MALSFNQLLFTTLHHRHLAIVGLVHAGGTVRQIAEDTGLGKTTVYRVLNSVGKVPGCGYGMRQFFVHEIEWNTDGLVIKRLPSSATVLVDEKRLEDLDQEEAEYKALNDLSDHHGYCIEGCHVTEVTRVSNNGSRFTSTTAQPLPNHRAHPATRQEWARHVGA